MLQCFLFHADNATYNMPMIGQEFRLDKSKKRKAAGRRGSVERKRELSTTSENLYESPYDEASLHSPIPICCHITIFFAHLPQGIAEVFSIYAALMPSTAEFRSSVKKVHFQTLTI